MNKELQTLIERAMQGDDNAFSEIVEGKKRELLYIACQYCELHDAEDAVQEALIKIYTHLPQLKDLERFNSWVYSVVKNSCLNGKRKMKDSSKTILFSTLDEMDHNAMEFFREDRQEFLPEEYVEAAEKRELIMNLIDTLPPLHREYLLLFYYEEMSYQEIAMLTGANKKKVANTLFRAKEQLKKKIEKQTNRPLVYSTLPIGAMPVLAQLYQAHAEAIITPQMCNRILPDVAIAAVKAGAENTAVASTTVGTGHATNSLVAGKLLVAALGTVTALGVGVGAYHYSQSMKSKAQPKPEVVAETITEIPVKEVVTIEPEQVPTQPQPEPSIDTVGDMIGPKQEAKLLSFSDESVDLAQWEAFITEIGAEKRNLSETNEAVYELYILEKQDKQLIMVIKRPLGGEEGIMKYEFGPIQPVVEMMNYMLWFET